MLQKNQPFKDHPEEKAPERLDMPKKKPMAINFYYLGQVEPERDVDGYLVSKNCPKCGGLGTFRRFAYHDPFGKRRCIVCDHREE